MGISIWQLLIVLVIIVLLFGTKKLRNIGGDLGSAMKSFKKAVGAEEEKKPQQLDQAEKQQEGRVYEGEASVEQPRQEKDTTR